MKYLLIALIFLSVNAQAYDFEVGLGRTNYTRIGDGDWWQSPFPHSERMQGNSFSIGLTGMVSDNWRGRVGYQYLGRTTSNCWNVSDYAYITYGAQATKYEHLTNAVGYGEVHVLYATISPEFQVSHVTVSPEFGFNAYVPTWDVDVWDNNGHYAGHLHHKQIIEVTPSVGLSFGYRNVSLAVTYYKRIDAAGDGYVGIYQGSATNISLRYKF